MKKLLTIFIVALFMTACNKQEQKDPYAGRAPNLPEPALVMQPTVPVATPQATVPVPPTPTQPPVPVQQPQVVVQREVAHDNNNGLMWGVLGYLLGSATSSPAPAPRRVEHHYHETPAPSSSSTTKVVPAPVVRSSQAQVRHSEPQRTTSAPSKPSTSYSSSKPSSYSSSSNRSSYSSSRR